jgi:hypothetical protein
MTGNEALSIATNYMAADGKFVGRYGQFIIYTDVDFMNQTVSYEYESGRTTEPLSSCPMSYSYLISRNFEWVPKKPFLEPVGSVCYHSRKKYIGFTDIFEYCEKCGIKL